MSQPYVGEIRLFAGNFPPNGWAFCQGQLLSIADNDVLFNLIGTTYGGDGDQTFALPNLQGRVPVHMGSLFGTNYVIGQMGGTEQETLTVQQIPAHTHGMVATTAPGTQNSPVGRVLAQSPSLKPYVEDVPSVSLSSQAVTSAGGSQPHDNRQPYVAVNYIISLFGVYPSPT